VRERERERGNSDDSMRERGDMREQKKGKYSNNNNNIKKFNTENHSNKKLFCLIGRL
jgi:hypothetical protein